MLAELLLAPQSLSLLGVLHCDARLAAATRAWSIMVTRW